MIFTAVMVPLTDFLMGVLSALALYIIGKKFLGERAPTFSVHEKQTSHAHLVSEMQ